MDTTDERNKQFLEMIMHNHYSSKSTKKQIVSRLNADSIDRT